MERRRSNTRRRSYLGAHAVYSLSQSFDCVVRDMTETGARLVFAEPPPAVHQFELFIPNKDWRRPVVVAWHDKCQLGVEFTAAPQIEDSAAGRLRELERRNAQLRNEIERLNVSM